MNNTDRLTICRTCARHSEDSSKGLLCKISGAAPSFEGLCPEFKEHDTGRADLYLNLVKQQLREIPASKGRRFLNFILDMVFYNIFSFVFGIILTVIGILIAPTFTQSILDSSIVSYLLSAIVFLGYYIGFEATTGRTLGKYITGTKVIDEHGSKPDVATAFVRTLFRGVPFDGISFLGDTDKKGRMGWHDAWSDTRVVMVRED